MANSGLPSDSRYSVVGQPQECQSAIKISHTIWDLKWVLNAADRSNSKRHLCLKTCVSADKNTIFFKGMMGQFFSWYNAWWPFMVYPLIPGEGGPWKFCLLHIVIWLVALLIVFSLSLPCPPSPSLPPSLLLCPNSGCPSIHCRPGWRELPFSTLLGYKFLECQEFNLDIGLEKWTIKKNGDLK